MTNFRFTLEKGGKKHRCPACGKRRFVFYTDNSNGDRLPEKYGRCDREINCGYHLSPYADGFASGHPGNWTPSPPPLPLPVSYIHPDIFRASLTAYHHNHFVCWLKELFDEATVRKLIARYHLGTSRHWRGATVFWQVDPSGKVRSGKIMLFDPKTGKRVKHPFNHINWVHTVMKMQNFNLQQCYFGYHLLKDENKLKPAAIVESEKSAIVASEYLPQFVWLAAGSLGNLNAEKFSILKNRGVVLFPDLGCFERWSQKAEELKRIFPGTPIIVSSLLEAHCDTAEKKRGMDLCDFLIHHDLKTYQTGRTIASYLREQWWSLKEENWIIDHQKYPELTDYNLELLCDDLNRKHKLQVNPAQYLEEYLSIKPTLISQTTSKK